MREPQPGGTPNVAWCMKQIAAAAIATTLLALAACSDLPPGRIPYQPNAQQGGGDANFNFQRNVGQ